MNKQLTEDMTESQLGVDQDDTGTLPDISLAPYGITTIELGLPARVTGNGNGSPGIVVVNGVALHKATEAEVFGVNNAFVGLPANITPLYTTGTGVTVNDTGISIIDNSYIESTVDTGQAIGRTTKPHTLSSFTDICTTAPGSITNYETVESIRRSLEIIIERAKDNGIVCGIDIVSRKPYAMSNYDMVPHVRKVLTR